MESRLLNAAAVAASGYFAVAGPEALAACTAPANPIEAENCRPGNPASEWEVGGAGDGNLQGFADDISYAPGETVNFKIESNTNTGAYRIDIYRLGYYGGQGARKVGTIPDTATLRQNQPACLRNTSGLADCGNWAVSASWTVPADAVSGIYVARPVRTATGAASHIVFVVREAGRKSDILFQTSDTTWQAYNTYGGNSLYSGSGPGTGGASDGRAYKVSYNRPFNTRAVDNGQDWLFNAEYPMVRWLEANGYDVSYFTGVDSDRRGSEIPGHRIFLSVGHDEYWSNQQRLNVEAARNNGLHIGFFSGNEVFWKTRWEDSIDGSGTPYRTLVCYKETHNFPNNPDPTDAWTGTWRDPRDSPPADGNRPENALTGTLFTVNAGATTAIQVPAEDGKLRLWRNTSIASLPPGNTATLTAGTLGYEWDEDIDNGFRPPGLIRLSTRTVPGAPVLTDFGSNFGSGPATHHLTLYRHGSGALVFGAGTVQWSWGLDGNHDNGSAAPDLRMRQATVNLFADMDVQPATREADLVAAAPSADATPPESTISAPASGASLALGTPVTIAGTAADTGGGVVGAVEVSVDAGLTWHPADGRGSWSYSWVPAVSGSTTLLSRAVDDSGNIETTPASIAVTVGGGTPNPCSGSTLWPATAVPAVASDSERSAVELGVRFRSDVAGTVCGIRFYKGTGNTGTHVGKLWSSTGTLLAQATFTGETASGWQQANFASPVAIAANTVYVASYHAPNGGYAINESYFGSQLDNPPLQGLRNGDGGGNGVYLYGPGGFPSSTFNASNYWVDVVFNGQTGGDTTPPTAPAGLTAAAAGSTGVNLSWTAATDNVGVTGYRVERCQGENCTNFTQVATPTGTGFADSGLTAGTVYTYRVRATDAAGNLGAYSAVASATTGSGTDTTAPTAPAGLTATAAGSSTVNLAWTAATDNVGVSGYRVERCQGSSCTNFVEVATPTGTSVADSGLTAGTTYRYRVRATDAAGNLGPYSAVASATTGDATATGCSGTVNSLWPNTATPTTPADSDTASVELGVKFRTDAAGVICGIRFYKGTGNTGTHVGKLWSSTGSLLAQATFTGETASGWQQVLFATPVPVTANTVYVASYLAPAGRYAVDSGADPGAFTAAGLSRPPLYALRNGESGGNGVYAYGTGGFPSSTFNASNYWVDVVFAGTGGGGGGTDTTAPTAPAGLSATAAGSSGINLTWTAATDNVGVTGYQVERCLGENCTNFAEVATPTGTGFADSGLTAGTVYTYRVRATDAAGNLGAYSAVASATTGPGGTAPVANPDLYLYLANVTRSVPVPGVLANDTAPAGAALSAQFGALTGGGTLNLAADGSFTYLRSTASNTVSFSYRASNGSLASADATVNLRVDSTPVTAADNCDYRRGSDSVVSNPATDPLRCTMVGSRLVRMDLARNDTDPNTTTDPPSDGVGTRVVPETLGVTAVGTGVSVAANAACGQTALGTSTARASLVNNCDGTVTVAVTPASTSQVSFSYRVRDDLGAQSAARQVILRNLQ